MFLSKFIRNAGFSNLQLCMLEKGVSLKVKFSFLRHVFSDGEDACSAVAKYLDSERDAAAESVTFQVGLRDKEIAG